jgi:hypothetical protein
VPDYIQDTFEAQRVALEDDEKQQAWLCTRRAGKTEGIARKLLQHAEERPDGASVYIAKTKGVARRNLSKKLKRFKRQYGVDIRERERDGQLLWVHANGHEIWLAGCKDKSECEKFRGEDQGFSLAVIDEGQSYPLASKNKKGHPDDEENRELLEYLVNDCLDPALLDQDGQLIIAGTPGVLPVGYFHAITTGDGHHPDGAEVSQWKTHTWTVFDNPHMNKNGSAETWLAKKMAKNGWTKNTPTVRREWGAEWVADKDSLIYRLETDRDLWFPDSSESPWLSLPGAKDEWYTVLGIDLGHDDATSFTLTASRRGYREVHVLLTWGGSEMTNSQRAAEWHRIKKRLGADGFKLHRTVVDTGALGKSIAYDLQVDYGVSCEAAEKQHKAAAIRRVQDMFRLGIFRFNGFGSGELRAEMSVLPWNDERTDHHPSYSDHWCDGFVYACREHSSFELREETPPEPGSPEAINQDMAAYKRRLMKRGKNKSKHRAFASR